MPETMALINYQDYPPKNYEKGICLAVPACPKKLLSQIGAISMIYL